MSLAFPFSPPSHWPLNGQVGTIGDHWPSQKGANCNVTLWLLQRNENTDQKEAHQMDSNFNGEGAVQLETGDIWQLSH